jgi:hypothetical protein
LFKSLDDGVTWQHEASVDLKKVFTTEGGWLSGNIGVGGGTGELVTWDGGVAIDAVVGEKRKRLQIVHEANDYTYAGIASINGNQVESVHQLFGEHNIELLAPHIQNLL